MRAEDAIAVPPTVADGRFDAFERRERAVWEAVARRLGLPRLDRICVELAPAEAEPPPPAAFARAEALLLGDGDAAILVAAPPPERRALVADFLARHPAERRRLAVASPREIRRALIERWSAALTRRAVRSVLDVDPDLSAAGRPGARPLAVMAVAAASMLAFALGFATALLAVWIFAFLLIGLFRLLVVDFAPPTEAPPVAEADLPSYAVLAPVHREAAVVEDLVAHLAALDYPADRLDVRIVVEADDVDTRRAAERAVRDTPFDLVVVPPSRPRTKPKALDFALQSVDADFVTVYDAEDRPDPDQLRRAVAVFASGPDDLAVVQAALETDHLDRSRPWLVRQFEIEYAVLFRAVLPWLAARRLFLPLGGTSNHFRRDVLVAVGGWDPHNVTEDADLAVRLRRAGWRAGVVASTTREEAPLRPSVWFAQRTRWLKGWMQTWMTHMRTPSRLHRELGLADSVLFHLIFAGQILSALTFAPSLAIASLQLIGWIAYPLGETLDGEVLALAAIFAFAAGMLSAWILALAVSARRARRFALPDVLTMPIYWCGVTLAAWAAAFDLLRAPTRWNKTPHGEAERRFR
ncbi:MAG: glycosyltransferase [Hyphomicrobiales bacterium]|nr:glycosyltransferase [Hyphomicrobiales bacterium]